MDDNDVPHQVQAQALKELQLPKLGPNPEPQTDDPNCKAATLMPVSHIRVQTIQCSDTAMEKGQIAVTASHNKLSFIYKHKGILLLILQRIKGISVLQYTDRGVITQC